MRGAQPQHVEKGQRAEVGMLDARAPPVRRQKRLDALRRARTQQLLHRAALLRLAKGTHLPRRGHSLPEDVRAQDLRQDEGPEDELPHASETRLRRFAAQRVEDHLVGQSHVLHMLRGRPLALCACKVPLRIGHAARRGDTCLDRGLVLGHGLLPVIRKHPNYITSRSGCSMYCLKVFRYSAPATPSTTLWSHDIVIFIRSRMTTWRSALTTA